MATMKNYFETGDKKAIDLQETKDYKLAVSALTMIYSAFTGHTIEYTPTERGCIADMRYFVSGDTSVRRYVGEIKGRNRDMDIDGTIPILAKKYTGLKRERKSGEKMFYINIYNNSWWLFDLDDLDFNAIDIRDWRINIVEKSMVEPTKAWYPTFFIPAKQAKIHGICLKGIPIAISSDKNCTA